jgi:hypothetical protein
MSTVSRAINEAFTPDICFRKIRNHWYPNTMEDGRKLRDYGWRGSTCFSDSGPNSLDVLMYSLAIAGHEVTIERIGG